MQRTRRGLLGAGVAVVGFAGCLGVDGVEYPDEVDDGPTDAEDDSETPDDDDSSDTPDGDSDDTAADQDGEPVPRTNEALAAATRAVVDDAVWFATEYPDAIASYRAAVRDVVAEIDAVRAAVDEEDAVAASMADRLAEAGRAAADRAADALEPQFRPRARIVSRTDRYVEPLRRFGRRGDVDRFLESLSRMRSAFAGLATATYAEEAFSRNPVHNRLLDRLLAPFPEDDDRRSDARDTIFVELAVPTRGFATFAHRPYDADRYGRSRIPRIYGTAVDADRREELRARLGPVPRPGDRTEEVFAAFASRPSPGVSPGERFEGWAHELDGTPVYVQRYPDSETAAERLASILDAAATEGRAPIDPAATAAGSNLSGSAGSGGDGGGNGDGGDDDNGGGGGSDGGSTGPTRWHRLYHHEATGERYGFDEHAGVQYGYVVQAGEFLLAAGFSGDAWEERAGWQRRLADGWVVA